MIFQFIFFLLFIPVLFSDTTYRVVGMGTACVDFLVPVNEEFLIQHVPGLKGSCHVCTTEFVDHLIEASQRPSKKAPGGSAANTIRGLAKLGERCAFYTHIGADSVGEFFAKSLQDCGIVGLLKVIPGYSTGRIVCMITPDGQRTLQAAFSPPPDAFFLHSDHLKNVQWMHFESYQFLCEDTIEKGMDLAKKAGAKISLDLSSYNIVLQFKDRLSHLIPLYVDVLFANEDETMAFTGLSPEEGCLKLQEICPIAVVKIGEKGCLIGHEGKILALPAFPAQLVDTTGAGDLFASGFLYGILNGFPLEACGRLGNRLGGSIVEVVGAELPEERWADIYKFLKEDTTCSPNKGV